VATGFREQRPRGATRRQSPERAATRRGRPGTAGHDMNPPGRLPDLFISSIYISFASTARSDRAAAALPLPTKLRPRLACSPLQKRVGQLVRSSAVFSSTFSTP